MIVIVPALRSAVLSDLGMCIRAVRSVGNIKISIHRNVSQIPEHNKRNWNSLLARCFPCAEHSTVSC
jgi:hypothetical protein